MSPYLDTEKGETLISVPARPITPRLPAVIRRTRPKNRKRLPHGRPFPIQEHHAPQGATGRPEVEAVRQAGARDHGGGEARDTRPRHESSAAGRRDRSTRGNHAK